ncbi:MAG: hypothetical protein FJ134_10580 [Deltaproteobacteria bacterium]|nr:hypothetical protein [Deltaproteobacteria bacterium]
MRQKKIIAVFFILALSVSACAPALQDYREDYVKSHPDLDPRIREAILKGEAVVGMTQEQVMASCGAPNLTTRGQEAGKYCDYWGYKRFTVTIGPDGKVINVK